MHKKLLYVFTIFFLLPGFTMAQHRGDNLAFQGLPQNNSIGVKAIALGSAFTSRSGDINSLFYNPAGLADIDGLQISIGANRYAKLWRENQVYRPNRMFWTMSFYLEGLYTPDPANNGKWDYELAQDSSYIVNPPQLGLDPFSEQAADWQKTVTDFGLNNIAAAYPLTFAGKTVVLAAAYSRNAFLDFDRNDTYLDPHIGYDEYGVVPRVVTDTVRFSWSRFTRSRNGYIQNITAGLAYNVSQKINIGLTVNYMTGKTTDFQSLNRVGYFDIAKDNRFRFSYDTLDVAISGNSKFSATSFNLGVVMKLERLSLGFNFTSPYKINRDWSYTYTLFTTDTSISLPSGGSGIDALEHPATISFGASITPADPFTISLDYQFIPYSQGKIIGRPGDTTIRPMPDQTEIRCGIEFRPLHFLSLLAGYRYMTETFVPDGAAIKDRGPAVTSYTVGASIKLFRTGRLDIAYDLRRLKYYDSYFSNTNYVFESFGNFLFGYTVGF